MLLRALLSPITAPLDGITWLAEKIQEQVDAEMDGNENLEKRLLSLQLAFDMGEMSEEDFEEQEEELLLAMQALNDQAKADEADAEADDEES